MDETRLEITGRGLKPQFKLETDPFEAGELHVNCTLIPLFAREKKENQSQMVSCDVRNAKNDMSVLSKPLNMVVSPQVTEMEVVFLCV